MRGKNIAFFGILFLTVMFISMSFVSAVVTLNTPAANSNITGTTYVLNATVSQNNGSQANLTRAWFHVMYANTTNITIASFVENVTNIGWNTTWNTNGVVDANNSLTFWVTVARGNGTVDNNETDNNLGVTVDNSASTAFLLNYTNATIRPATNLTINISLIDNLPLTAADVCIIDVNGTNQTIVSTPINSTYATCNTTTLSLKGLGYGNHTIKIYTGRTTTTGNWSGNLTAVLATHSVFVDATGPSIQLSPTQIERERIVLAIEASDPVSGVASCSVDRENAVVSGTSSVTEDALDCGTEYSYVVTCTDNQGSSGSESITVRTNNCASGGAATSTTGASKPVVNNVAEVSPGAASVTTYTDPELGVKQIEITVDNTAQNVQVSVTKYASKPAEVSVAKTGKVYQYLEIDTTNLADKLDKAKVQFKIAKTWATTNQVDKEELTVYKFDEAAKIWNELATTLSSEDATYYYLDAELTSFSFFAISERSLVAGEGTDVNGEMEEGSNMWVWIIVIVLVIALVAWLLMRNKN